MQTLSHSEARRYYDRLGSVQDWQRPFEQPARESMTRRSALPEARAVFELGCGTGRFGKDLLESGLPLDARYLAVDASETMLKLARKNLARFGQRVEVRASSGEMRFDVPDASFDRFLSTYVFDLLSERNIEAALAEAHRMLRPGGLLGLVSLTHGATGFARQIERAWMAMYRYAPALTGGCRPLELLPRLPVGRWRLRHHEVLTRLGISSEVVVAERSAAAGC